MRVCAKTKPARCAPNAACAACCRAFRDVPIAKAWGGPIDVSADRLPFFKTIPGTRVHFGCGYSGHGVNPTYIGGQCLASLVLNENDCGRTCRCAPRIAATPPPEPFRYLGGRAVRRAIIACEEAEEQNRRPPPLASAVAALPRLLGLRIGTR